VQNARFAADAPELGDGGFGHGFGQCYTRSTAAPP
jgi:hypothetical protein